jgi:hypothetical protein
MPAGTSPEANRTADPGRYLVIVARDQVDLWRHLVKDFAEFKKVQVHLDRREEERRHSIRAHHPDRRGIDRRCWPGIDRELLSRPYVIVPAHTESY